MSSALDVHLAPIPPWPDGLIVVSSEDGMVSLPHTLRILPEKTIILKAEIDPAVNPSDSDQTLRLSWESDDPDHCSGTVEFHIYTDLPLPEFFLLEERSISIDTVDWGEIIQPPRPGSPSLAKRVSLGNKGGGILVVQSVSDAPPWLRVVPPPHPVHRDDTGFIGISIDQAQPLPSGLQQGELIFTFQGLSEPAKLKYRLNVVQAPKARLRFVDSKQRDVDFIEQDGVVTVQCDKGRKIDYQLQIENAGGGTLNVTALRLAEGVHWARLYKGMDPLGVLKPDKLGQYSPITLVVDTSGFAIDGSSHRLEILVDSNDPDSPTKLTMEFQCKRRKLNQDTYVGIDFGTTNSSGAAILDEGGFQIEPLRFTDEDAQVRGERASRDQDEDGAFIPSIILFRDIDDVVIGPRVRGYVDQPSFYERSIRVLKRMIGRDTYREIMGKRYHPEEVAEFIFQAFIDKTTDLMGKLPVKIVATCPAAFYNYQRAAIRRSCRRVLFRRLLSSYKPELDQPGIERFFSDKKLDGEALKAFDRLRRIDLFQTDQARYGSWDETSYRDVLIRSLIFVLEQKYRLWRQETRMPEDVLKDLQTYIQDLLNHYVPISGSVRVSRLRSKNVPQDIEQIIDIIEDLVGEVFQWCNLLDVQILDEPTAAAYDLIYLAKENLKPAGETILVYDFGGGTTDVAVVRVSFDAAELADVQVLAIGGTDVGGENIDKIILEKGVIDHLIAQNKEAWEDYCKSLEAQGIASEIVGEARRGIPKDLLMAHAPALKSILASKVPDPVWREAWYSSIIDNKGRLKAGAEEQKINLSTRDQDTFDYTFSPPEFTNHPRSALSVSFELRSDKLNEWIKDDIEEGIQLVNLTLRDAARNLGVSPEEMHLDRVLLVGKASKTPLFRKRLQERFGWTDNLFDKTLEKRVKSCVASGAAYYGGIYGVLESRGLKTSHVLSHHVGYINPANPDQFVIASEQCADGTPIRLTKGTAYSDVLTCRVEIGFYSSFAEQQVFIVQSDTDQRRVFTNRRLRCIGKYTFTVIQPQEGHDKVILTFTVDESGMVDVQGTYVGKPIGQFYKYQKSRPEEENLYIFV